MLAGVVFVLGYSTYFFELAGFADSNAFKLGLGGTGVGVRAFLLMVISESRFTSSMLL